MCKTLTLEDLKMKPTEDMHLEDNRIKNVTMVKNFHFGGIMTIDILLENCRFLNGIKLSPMHIFNIINLLLELYKSDMDRWETLSIDDLKDKPCTLVWKYDPNDFMKMSENKILGIGNSRGEYIFIEEIIELIK